MRISASWVVTGALKVVAGAARAVGRESEVTEAVEAEVGAVDLLVTELFEIGFVTIGLG